MALAAVAARLAANLPDGAFVALEGDLGAGKTTFVKLVAAAAGIDPAEVVSPTFGLIHVHEGPRCRLVHADMYRLPDQEELRETGWEDAIAARTGTSTWVFVEWPVRIGSFLPADRLDVAIGIDSETARTLTFAAGGPLHAPVIAALTVPATATPLQSPP
jgi:tRNA threonylcarbamoyl adenosine modification protein YjeE